jgi:hypothetical protein
MNLKQKWHLSGMECARNATEIIAFNFRQSPILEASQKALSRAKPIQASFFAPHQLALKPQLMQMRQRLALREGELMQIERALEHDGDDVVRGLRALRACVDDLLQALSVVCMQLRNALMQADEGLAVAGEGERVWREGCEAVDGI